MPATIYRDKDGERIPGVTTVINQWGIKTQPLLHWAYKRGEKGVPMYEKEEADVGTLAHMMIEYHLNDRKLDVSEFPASHIEQAQTCFDNFLTWRQQHRFEPIKTEISLISEKHKYGGTIDCVALIDDVLSIFDWKSGKDIYEDHVIQLESYKHLWDENFPRHPVNGFHIIRTGKEIAMFAHNFYKEFPKAWEVFLHLRDLYDLAKEIKKLK